MSLGGKYPLPPRTWRGTIENAENTAALFMNFLLEMLDWLMGGLAKFGFRHNIFHNNQSQKYPTSL